MAAFQIPPLENHQQFELLLCDFLNEHYQTISFKCFGKNGHHQKGIDVFSAEKGLIVQCKHKDLSRSPIKIKKEVLNDIEETLSQLEKDQTSIPFDTLIIATTASEHPEYDEYCEEIKKEKGLTCCILFWGWETIQRKLSNSPKTMTIHYPGFQLTTTSTEEVNVNRVVMKKQIQRDFAEWLNYDVKNRNKSSKAIIHWIGDTHYPAHLNDNGPYFWFGAEISRLSVKGFGFVTGITQIYVNERNIWSPDKPAHDDEDLFKPLKVAVISVIDFADIVDYDLEGDEHYNRPHIYAKFSYNDGPFCEVYYQNLEVEKRFGMLYIDDNTRLVS